MPRTLSLLAVLKKVDAKGVKSLSNAQWDTFLASDTEPNEIQDKIKKLEGYENTGATYDKTGELIPEDNDAMIARFRERTGRGVGRESLKVKKSKIDVASFKKDFLNKKEEPVKPDATGASALATLDDSRVSIPDKGEDETEGLKGIRDVLDDILKVLRLDFKDDRKEARDRQKEDKMKKRTKKEEKLEGGIKKSIGLIGKSLKAIVSPFSDIWNAVINFLKFTLIGVLFTKTMKWFGDPKNEKKAERIGKFFRDWWPALAAAGALFLTPLGVLLNGVVGLLTAIIPKLIMAIAANPWAATAVLGGVAIYGLSKKIGNMQDGGDGNEEKDETVEMKSGGLVQEFGEGGLVQQFEKGGTVGMMGATGAMGMDGAPGAMGMDGGMREPNQENSIFNILNLLGLMGGKGFNKGGGVPGSGNKDTVPAMLTPGEFVMSKGAVNKYGMDTLENMNAAAGSGSPSKDNDTVPSMLTPGEFVVSAPAVQKFGVNTLESMNLKGGGDNKPKISVGANNGGLINNYNLQYKGGGSVPQGMMRFLAGAADFVTGGVFDFDKRGSITEAIQRMKDKGSVGTPVVESTNKIITLPTIPKDKSGETTTSKNDIPDFRISMNSPQRSMVISSLGIQDLIGG